MITIIHQPLVTSHEPRLATIHQPYIPPVAHSPPGSRPVYRVHGVNDPVSWTTCGQPESSTHPPAQPGPQGPAASDDNLSVTSGGCCRLCIRSDFPILLDLFRESRNRALRQTEVMHLLRLPTEVIPGATAPWGVVSSTRSSCGPSSKLTGGMIPIHPARFCQPRALGAHESSAAPDKYLSSESLSNPAYRLGRQPVGDPFIYSIERLQHAHEPHHPTNPPRLVTNCPSAGGKGGHGWDYSGLLGARSRRQSGQSGQSRCIRQEAEAAPGER